MNGTQSTGDPRGLQPGDASHAERAARSYRRLNARLDVDQAARSLKLALDFTADVDLARALEKIEGWLAREAGPPGEGQLGGEAPHGEAQEAGG